MSSKTESLYQKTASQWQRKTPNSLSDFTARARLFDLCEPVAGTTIVDLGAGEGYCARELASRGAARVDAIELSARMIDLAKAQQSADDNTIDYRVGNVVDLPYEDNKYDMAVGVFVYNYLTIDDIHRSFKEVFRVLKAGGQFIFAVPHPSFPFIRRERTAPFFFDTGDYGYFSSRDKLFTGKISCRDGKDLEVQMIPKSLQDYFEALNEAGFNQLPIIEEFRVTDAMIKLDQEFFSPLEDIPLHLAFKINR